MPDTRILVLEKTLASAFHSTVRAYSAAQELDLYGLADDLWSLSLELGVCLDDFMKKAPHQKVSRF